MFNNVVLVGRMATDPELKYTPSGVAVGTFRLAVNRPFPDQKGEKQADFLDIVAWRQQAEFAANYLGKGRQVLVEGRIQVRSYENGEGQRRKVWEIVAENLRGLDRPKDSGAAESTAAASAQGGEGSGDDPFQDE